MTHLYQVCIYGPTTTMVSDHTQKYKNIYMDKTLPWFIIGNLTVTNLLWIGFSLVSSILIQCFASNARFELTPEYILSSTLQLCISIFSIHITCMDRAIQKLDQKFHTTTTRFYNWNLLQIIYTSEWSSRLLTMTPEGLLLQLTFNVELKCGKQSVDTSTTAHTSGMTSRKNLMKLNLRVGAHGIGKRSSAFIWPI